MVWSSKPGGCRERGQRTGVRLPAAGYVSQPPQWCQSGVLCTMRRPSDPHHHHHHPQTGPLIKPWLVLVALFVCVFAGVMPCVGASASANGEGGRGIVCGTPFTDIESSAVLADVVLEGRVRQKVSPKDPAVLGYYNVSIQVRKQVWKGRELVNGGRKARKLLLGTFRDASQSEDSASQVAASASSDNNNDNNRSNKNNNNNKSRGGGKGMVGSAGDGPPVQCVGQVENGATYIFFLREVGDKKGKYFQLSAIPVKKNRRESRKVSKILKKNAAQKPNIQRLKAPRKVTAGSSLTLRCKAKAKPPAIYSWFQNGQPLKSGRGLRIKSNKRGSRLKINKAKEGSAGVYTCKAANAVGEASKNVTVKVNAAASIHKPCEKQTFCFNGGSCRYLPDLQQTFCQCPKRWAGRRCELLDPLSVGLDPDNLNRAASLEYERILIIVGIVIAILVFVVICIVSYFLAKRRRKRWETKRRMKQNAGRERDRLLDQADGAVHPARGLPIEKETQTEDIHPPDLPPKRDHSNRANFIHSPRIQPDSPFHMDAHFPLITSVTTPNFTASPPSSANSRRAAPRPGSGRDGKDLERRESRSRLKAVSVDDSCKDRPPSWKADSEGPSRDPMPIREGSNEGHPEMIEMNNLGPSVANLSQPAPTDKEGIVNGLPGFLSSFSSPGMTDEPIKMNRPPRDNAHAQLKTPQEESYSFPSATQLPDYDVPKSANRLIGLHGAHSSQPEKRHAFNKPNERAVLPVNGVLLDSDTESEDERKALPPLHISEEDLNGNLSKANSLDSGYLPRPSAPEQSAEEASSASSSYPSPPLSYAAHRPKDLPTVLIDGVYVPAMGHSTGSASEDDCAGFLPHAMNSCEGVPRGDIYAFDPGMDSDPNELDGQFMHGSPRKSPRSYSGPDVQRDYERRLQNVRADQEPIPI